MNKKNFNIGVATKASLFFIPRRERKRTSTPLPPRNKSIVKPPPPLFFERVITRDTMHANPDILDGNAISGRRRGEGEGGQIPRWWIRLKNGLLEGDPEHPAKRIDDGGRPHSPAAQALCDFLITGEEASPSPPLRLRIRSRPLFTSLLLFLLGLYRGGHATTRVFLPSLRGRREKGQLLPPPSSS